MKKTHYSKFTNYISFLRANYQKVVGLTQQKYSLPKIQKLEVQNRGVSRAALSEASLVPSSPLMVAGFLWHSLACSCITAASASAATWIFPESLCLHMAFLQGHVTGFKDHPNSSKPLFTNLWRQRPYFQISIF